MKKGKGFIGEFKEFVMRGNVMDLAVGVIIGAAFQGIVNSLVNDILMPVITLITGGLDFNNWFIALDGNSYGSLAEAQAAEASTLNYGVFLTALINFLIMAFVIFMIVKIMNRLAERNPFRQDKEEEAVPETKVCPYCKSEIPADATRCAYCTSDLTVQEQPV